MPPVSTGPDLERKQSFEDQVRLVIAGASLSVLSFPTSPLALRETVDLMSNQLSATPRAIEAAK